MPRSASLFPPRRCRQAERGAAPATVSNGGGSGGGGGGAGVRPATNFQVKENCIRRERE